MKRANYLLLLILLMSCYFTQAQYESNNVSYDRREHSSTGLEKITVSPSKILIDMYFYSDNKDDKIRISDQTFIQFPDFYNKKFYTKIRSGVNSYLTDVPRHKKTYFTIGFNVDVSALIDSKIKNEKYLDILYLKGEMPFDFIDCDESYRRANEINYGSCFDYLGIRIKMDLEKWNALYSYGKLESLMKKDEFETSSEYTTRTSPDSLSKQLKNFILKFTSICEGMFELESKNIKPGITYNADERTFTLTYPGAEAAKIKMDVESARKFKEGVLNGSIQLKDMNVNRLSSGKYLIDDLTFNQTKYTNILTDADESNRAYIAGYRRVEEMVKNLQRENGAAARVY